VRQAGRIGLSAGDEISARNRGPVPVNDFREWYNFVNAHAVRRPSLELKIDDF